MEQHVKTLAWLHIGFGALGVMFGMLIGVTVTVAGLASGDPGAATIGPGVGLLVAVLVAAFSLPAIATGYGLLHHRPWARIAGIVLAILSLPGLPLGTLLGAYGLWVLFNEQTSARFTAQPAF
jgi:hypothetical protein